MDVWAIVAAAGAGHRFGSAKQYAHLGDRRVLDHAVVAARVVATGVVLVVPPDRRYDAEPACDVVVVGGADRSASVRAGLAVVPESAEVIVVHDAARPFASASLFRAVVEAVLAGADGAVPGIPVTDTIKRVEGERVTATVERRGLVTVQTPQAFAAAALRRAHGAAPSATDDAALVEAVGGRVVVVPGETANLKLTDLADLHRAERWLREDGPSAAGSAR